MELYKLLDFFLPVSCEFCGKFDYFSSKIGVCKLCHRKHSNVSNSLQTLCKICKEVQTSKECFYCNSRNVFFEELKFLRNRTPFLAKVINCVKLRFVYSLSIYLSLGLKKELKHWKNLNFSGILLVPSTKTKWYSKNKPKPFESCEFILKRLQKILSYPWISPIEKISDEKQAGKSLADRFIHARLAFKIKKEYKGKLRGNYLLIDDVFTTGASANELARILIQNGADSVRILTLIRTEGIEFEIEKDITNV
ncbi:ComF family protein [Leptospira noguchii]|uniref:ComF family protein n=1 Tax=Leptospira noguchii TaxID=28182 RepID=UPI001FB5FBD1|nr:ComF family protein [Leptospira noguchii]UOG49282.1 ComF family protein [Leptospira noguchii]